MMEVEELVKSFGPIILAQIPHTQNDIYNIPGWSTLSGNLALFGHSLLFIFVERDISTLFASFVPTPSDANLYYQHRLFSMRRIINRV